MEPWELAFDAAVMLEAREVVTDRIRETAASGGIPPVPVIVIGTLG